MRTKPVSLAAAVVAAAALSFTGGTAYAQPPPTPNAEPSTTATTDRTDGQRLDAMEKEISELLVKLRSFVDCVQSTAQLDAEVPATPGSGPSAGTATPSPTPTGSETAPSANSTSEEGPSPSSTSDGSPNPATSTHSAPDAEGSPTSDTPAPDADQPSAATTAPAAAESEPTTECRIKLPGQAKPAESPTATPTPTTKPAAPAAATPATAGAGEVVFPKTGKPSDPGDKRVISPNPSPLIPASKLTGKKIVVKPGQPLGPIFEKTLAPGTVVVLPRGEVYTQPVTITGAGTADQPVLVTAADGPGQLPTFTPAEVGNKNAAMVTTRGQRVQLEKLRLAGGEPKIGFDLGAYKGVADRIETDGAVNGVWIRDGDQGGTGEGTAVWNSRFTNGRMQVGMNGPEDDYGATAIAVEANGVTAEGITGRNLLGDSPDYNKYGGDGALFEGWRKVNGFRGAHSSVKGSPRVFEAGGLEGDGEAHAVIQGVYADGLTDAPFHVQDGAGPYSGLKTTYKEIDNNINTTK